MRISLPFFLFAVLAVSCVAADKAIADSVTDFPHERIAAISREIDRLGNVHLASLNFEPNPLTDDETFLRRIHLEIVGRIPTLQEASAFLDSSDPNKRSVPID